MNYATTLLFIRAVEINFSIHKLYILFDISDKSYIL